MAAVGNHRVEVALVVVVTPVGTHAGFGATVFVANRPPGNVESAGDSFEIPAGLFDDDPELKPDKHILVEFVPPWDCISDNLPKLDIRELFRERNGRDLPDDFLSRYHANTPRDTS